MRFYSILVNKFACFLMLFGCFTFPSHANFINALTFKDTALKTCLIELAAEHQWQKINDVTGIKCHNKNIVSLSGIEVFTALKNLSLFNNKLVTADLRRLSQLENINLANNKLQEIKLNNLTHVHTLYLFKNKLTTLDFTGLTGLKKMRITDNQINQLNISPLISLEKAYLFNNQLEDLIVAGLPNLKFIELRQNPMPDEVYNRYDALNGITILHDGNAEDWQ